jgi:hypothetical protein
MKTLLVNFLCEVHLNPTMSNRSSPTSSSRAPRAWRSPGASGAGRRPRGFSEFREEEAAEATTWEGAMHVGADAVLAKPFEPVEFLNLVARLVRNNGTMTAAS